MHLLEPIERITPRVNLNVNYGLWMIMMDQCGFIGYNRDTLCVGGMVIMGEVVHVSGQGYMENFCTFSSLLL